MKISRIHSMSFGVTIEGLESGQVSDQEALKLKKLLYQYKLVVLKNQTLDLNEFIAFGEKLGEIETYYEPIYHHPERKEVFVSSNVQAQGAYGVPKTGSFWHSDYAFMKKPFAFTITYPQLVPNSTRGTFFINMVEAYESLDENLKDVIQTATCQHSVRKYFKIRPADVYRPISALIEEVENVTPEVTHPVVVTHPVTGEKLLYINEGFSMKIMGYAGAMDADALLQLLLEKSGQLDKSFNKFNIQLLEIEKGDIIMWDNRSLIHHAKHAVTQEPAVTFRLTVHDGQPFSGISLNSNQEISEVSVL